MRQRDVSVLAVCVCAVSVLGVCVCACVRVCTLRAGVCAVCGCGCCVCVCVLCVGVCAVCGCVCCVWARARARARRHAYGLAGAQVLRGATLYSRLASHAQVSVCTAVPVKLVKLVNGGAPCGSEVPLYTHVSQNCLSKC